MNYEEFKQKLKEVMTIKSFSLYTKIPYETVTGWKKKGEVPYYAVIIVDLVRKYGIDILKK